MNDPGRNGNSEFRIPGSEVPACLSGFFLIAQTELLDPNFYRTVVLITEHNEEGAFGLIANRKLDSTLGEIIPSLASSECGGIPVYIGGPVEQHYLFVLHGGIRPHESDVLAMFPVAGVVFEPLTESLLKYIKYEYSRMDAEKRPKIHVFAGYSGWGPGQLESELKAGSWFVVKAQADIVFMPDPAKSWEEALSRKGPLFEFIARTGTKPSLN